MKRTTTHTWLLPLIGGATAVFVYAASVEPVRGANEDGRQETTPSTRADTARQSDRAEAEPAETTVTVGNVVVGVDPKTGDMRPLTAAERASLAREMRRLFKPRDLHRVERGDGSLSAVVAPNVLRFSVARIGKEGTVSRSCEPGQESALEFLTAAAPASKAGPKEE